MVDVSSDDSKRVEITATVGLKQASESCQWHNWKWKPILRVFTVKDGKLDRPNFHFTGFFYSLFYSYHLPPLISSSVFTHHDSSYEVLNSYRFRNKLSLISLFLQLIEGRSFSVLSDHRVCWFITSQLHNSIERVLPHKQTLK